MFIGETMSLYLAIKWIRHLSFKDVVIFELDTKLVVDELNSKNVDIFKFGCFVKARRSLFFFFNNNFHVEFAKKNAIKGAHIPIEWFYFQLVPMFTITLPCVFLI